MIIPPLVEYVYAIGEDNFDTPIKIGRSTEPTKRLSQMQVGCVSKLRLLHAHACENNTWFEKALHIHFKSRQVRGEWYEITPEEFVSACEMLETQYLAMLAGEKLCDQLTLYRKKRGLSQQELSKRSGLRQATISKIENGQGGNFETYATLAAALGLTIVAHEVI